MRIPLLGKTSQIGSKSQSTLLPLDEIAAPARKDLDLGDIGALRSVIVKYRPTFIVDATAHTNVNLANSEPARTHRVNRDAVAALTDYASCNNARFAHHSTDYVFDGKKDVPYLEDDATRPLNVYGATKRDGGRAVRAAKDRHLIAATSWYGFAKFLFGEASRQGLKLRCSASGVRVILAADYETSVTRPANLRLDTAKLCKIFYLDLPSWPDHARKVVSEFSAGAMA
ncbi:SDR family oxidoreductase [Afipia massiliensis]|uniref:SDR family oxidoreductase n=1 Tax=Afipia massiliensis TaxID=211460 RepID=UPI000AB87E95|nr:sugar nucleotide-binding protein [Afipia massiliensis]